MKTTGTNYFEDEEAGQDTGMDEEKGGMEGEGKGEEGGETFLVNRAAYPDAKPGDRFMMRVEAVHENEMECSVEPMEKEEKDEEPEPEMAEMPEGEEGGGEFKGLYD
jgi:hypothetical protein